MADAALITQGDAVCHVFNPKDDTGTGIRMIFFILTAFICFNDNPDVAQAMLWKTSALSQRETDLQFGLLFMSLWFGMMLVVYRAIPGRAVAEGHQVHIRQELQMRRFSS